MKRYLKHAVQVMVLTAVLVFSGMLVANTGFVAQDAMAHCHEPYTVHYPKYENGQFQGYFPQTDYR